MGAFGNYKPGSAGAILNDLVDYYGIPLTTVEQIKIGNGTLHYRDKAIANFKWFDGWDHVCVMFRDSDFRMFGEQNQWIIKDGEEGVLKPKFKVTLGVHGNPQFEIIGEYATEQLHAYMRYPMLTNSMDNPCYELMKKCGAFFQGGSHDPKGKWIMIEFWNPNGIKDWMEYLNNNYRHDPVKWKKENE